MNEFSYERRKNSIVKFSQEVFDLAIVGGGITGAGVARDAASRGMRVALVEANDFASGTSSRSSKLIHGGIRYLENLEIGLVFEALRERKILTEIAPHLVHPLRFLLPLYKGGRVSMFKMGLGMWLYDALSLFEVSKMHESLTADETIKSYPFMEPEGLLGAYLYSDAYMDDDRLVIETLRSAVNLGAECVNYVKAERALFEPGKSGDSDAQRMQGLVAKDLESGQEIVLRAKHFVSTVGPWTDRFAAQLFPNWSQIMRPSKGIHLTLSRKRFPLESAVVMAADQQKRIVFAIPRQEMVIVGTTDTDFHGNLDSVCTKRSDVEYLLRVIGEYFPGMKITEKDVISSYAGVRPLVHDGSESEGKTSREHIIMQRNEGLTLVAGGKYTTYRHMAQQTVEATLAFFSLEDQMRFARGHTLEPLNPFISADSYCSSCAAIKEHAKAWSIDQGLARAFILRHGLEAEKLVGIYHQLPKRGDLKKVMWQTEALFAMKNSMSIHLDDFILRRTPLFLSEP
ncbi:MAG: glycerol-3-phosphate dehydrogenase/oxidase, partial [Bdellovibrionales bacterium]|nr:glycerol-3-phosphate dehydrogenase/oxidase [Bdellovibrionales bacterium]